MKSQFFRYIERVTLIRSHIYPLHTGGDVTRAQQEVLAW